MADSNDVFNPNTPTEEGNPDADTITLDVLVGEDRKYKTVDDLAKAYYNADSFISKTKAERAEMEAELKVLRDLVEKRNGSEPKNRTDDNVDESRSRQRQEDPPADGDLTKKSSNEDLDIATLVKEELNKAKEEDTRTTNVNKVAESLSNHYGSAAKANEIVRQKAAELEVSVDWLMDLAARTPQGFYRMVGFDTAAASRPSPNSPGTSVNTEPFRNRGNARNFKYYENLRKSEPKVYYSAQIQKQLLTDAREQGSEFYS